MLVTSRSAAEYRAMFGLTPPDLANASVLDCCAGGASFTAELAAERAAGPGSGSGSDNARVLAVDPVYAIDRRDLADRVHGALRDGDRIIDAHADRFEWRWYGTPERRTAMRRAAARRFLRDFGAHPGRYVAAALPHLPLADGSFDLVLCSHALFTWSDQLDAAWHRAALDELVRVSRREVRIYPLVVQGTGRSVDFFDELRSHLHAAGHITQLTPVPYRFQRSAHAMLVVEASK
jgi:SAM-dependent methyltransferase